MAVLGIDFGSSNCFPGVLDGAEVELLDKDGQRAVPTAVAFPPDRDGPVVGKAAVRAGEAYPSHTVTALSRHLERGTDGITVRDGTREAEYAPEALVAMVFEALVRAAEESLNEPVEEVGITVPASYPPVAREATKDAAQLAGVDVRYVLPAPLAACIAYTKDSYVDSSRSHRVAVYDFGGRTFDFSVVDVASDRPLWDVQATTSEPIGGQDIDGAITGRLIDAYKVETGVDVSEDAEARRLLRREAKLAKEDLSVLEYTEIVTQLDGTVFRTELCRDEFHEFAGRHVEATVEACNRLLGDLGIAPGDADTVLLTGGSSRIPMVRGSVEEFFDVVSTTGIAADEGAVRGATDATDLDVQRSVIEDLSP